ncbi:MAG TPA: hypothetical protein DHV26_00145 [Cytophagales bacterium]|nr:hypothetical protein [Cytophagales bacterium]
MAKYLYNLTLADTLKDTRFAYCSQVGYSEIEHQILVFDERFIDDNFNKSTTLKGVFFLNKKNDGLKAIKSRL